MRRMSGDDDFESNTMPAGPFHGKGVPMKHASDPLPVDANLRSRRQTDSISPSPPSGCSAAPPGGVASALPSEEQAKQSASNKTYGYARVSSSSQNLARQIDALVAYGVEPKLIVSDKASGKDFDRPGYTRLVRRLKPGDTVVVGSIDRFGRSYDEILEEWKRITSVKRANIVVMDMPILDTRVSKGGLTSQFINDIVLQLLSYVAQTERDYIRKRQAEGIQAAHARGVKFGRPVKTRPANYSKVCEDIEAGATTLTQAANLLGVCPATLRKWRREDASC